MSTSSNTPGANRVDVDALQSLLSRPAEREFCQRVWSTDLAIFDRRLKAVGFVGMEKVLDAGSGMGQWSVAMGRLNKSVVGIDNVDERVQVSETAARAYPEVQAQFLTGDLTRLPFADNSFDGVFSYSVVCLTDFRAVFREFHRVLKPGGLLYFCTNGLGWYLHNLIDGHNTSEAFDSRAMAIRALANTIQYYARGRMTPGSDVIMPVEVTLDFLREMGFEIVQEGPEGTICVEGAESPRAFFPGSYHDEEGVWEALCRKAQVSSS